MSLNLDIDWINQPDTIELRTAKGRLIDRAHALGAVLLNVGHYDIHVRDRRIRSAKLKQRESLAPLSRAGEVYVQALESGRVFALRGTPGAVAAPVIA